MAEKTTIKAQDFRVVPADAFSLRMNDNMAKLTFALETEDIILENTIVGMTPRSLKVLSIILTNVIAKFEADNGVIPIAPGKVEELQKSIKVTKENLGSPKS